MRPSRAAASARAKMGKKKAPARRHRGVKLKRRELIAGFQPVAKPIGKRFVPGPRYAIIGSVSKFPPRTLLGTRARCIDQTQPMQRARHLTAL
jgi:hypothetical protein